MTTELKPGILLKLEPCWDDAGPIYARIERVEGCNDTLQLPEGALNGQWAARIVEDSGDAERFWRDRIADELAALPRRTGSPEWSKASDIVQAVGYDQGLNAAASRARRASR